MSTKKKTIEEVRLAFNNVGLNLTSSTYINALIPLESMHIDCGHTRSITYGTVSKAVKANRKIVCKTCGTNKKPRSTEQVSLEILDRYGLEFLDEYTKIKSIVSIRDPRCGHIYKTNLEHLLYSGIGSECKICADTTRNRFFSSLISNKVTVDESEYTGAHGKINVRYTCGHTCDVIPNNTVCAGSGLICRVCHPLPRDSSKPQRELYDLIKRNYTGAVILNDRKVLEGKEIDIYIPELNLGIEFNGMYWHSDKFLDPMYHKNKADLAACKGIKLIQVFETEWLIKKDIVLSRILSHLGWDFTLYARHCTIEKVHNINAFLEANHLQGAGVVAPIIYALKFMDEIVSVMTFCKSRYNAKYDYELLRFCTLTGVRVVGGASKMLKLFRKEYPGSIVSYADRRYSTGNVYKALGFSYSHTSQPNYKYHKYKTTYTRYQCQKHKLKALLPEFYRDELSESEIMRNAGFNKVYDAGNLVYTM